MDRELEMNILTYVSPVSIMLRTSYLDIVVEKIYFNLLIERFIDVGCRYFIFIGWYDIYGTYRA